MTDDDPDDAAILSRQVERLERRLAESRLDLQAALTVGRIWFDSLAEQLRVNRVLAEKFADLSEKIKRILDKETQ